MLAGSQNFIDSRFGEMVANLDGFFLHVVEQNIFDKTFVKSLGHTTTVINNWTKIVDNFPWSFLIFIDQSLELDQTTFKIFISEFIWFIPTNWTEQHSALDDSMEENVSGGGKSREEVIYEIATLMEQKTPALFDFRAVVEAYPTKYEESMNTVLA